MVDAGEVGMRKGCLSGSLGLVLVVLLVDVNSAAVVIAGILLLSTLLLLLPSPMPSVHLLLAAPWFNLRNGLCC